MEMEKELIRVRTVAVLAILLFLPVIVSFAVAPGALAFEYPGIFFHLILLLMVARLKAPEWARAAGYGWLTLDVATGALLINGVPPETAGAVRLGGHIFAGLWIAMASQFAPRIIRVIGTITGVWLGGYTFFAPFVPKTLLAPASLLMISWLGLLAWKDTALSGNR